MGALTLRSPLDKGELAGSLIDQPYRRARTSKGSTLLPRSPRWYPLRERPTNRPAGRAARQSRAEAGSRAPSGGWRLGLPTDFQLELDEGVDHRAVGPFNHGGIDVELFCKAPHV